MYKLNLRGYILAVIGRALLVVAGYLDNVPLMMLFTAVAALGQGPWQGDMNVVIASCSEYTYLTQGKRVDGTMYSCTSLGVKIAAVSELLLSDGFWRSADMWGKIRHILHPRLPCYRSCIYEFHSLLRS